MTITTGCSLSWNYSHTINILSINEANQFQMSEEIFMNFTPKPSIRCNQSKLSSDLTVEETENHLVRKFLFLNLRKLEQKCSTAVRPGQKPKSWSPQARIVALD